jgi:hypothetical protein
MVVAVSRFGWCHAFFSYGIQIPRIKQLFGRREEHHYMSDHWRATLDVVAPLEVWKSYFALGFFQFHSHPIEYLQSLDGLIAPSLFRLLFACWIRDVPPTSPAPHPRTLDLKSLAWEPTAVRSPRFVSLNQVTRSQVSAPFYSFTAWFVPLILYCCRFYMVASVTVLNINLSFSLD